tara:strand:- start:6568 stop:10608 length:4041 start_codon:yes stop_codon:yes gene_type:complete
MNKAVKYTYLGANQDIGKSKHVNTYYYDAEHIRIRSTDSQSSGVVANEKGTELVITIPDISISTANSNVTYGTKVLSYRSGGGIDTQVAAGNLPISSTEQQIIGATSTRTGIILFTTDELGVDCVWNIDNIVANDYTLDLIYLRDLNFSLESPIQAIFNYENENIQKVYWVDGKEQIRFLNVKHNLIEGNGELIDIPSTSIDFVGTVDFSQPLVIDTVGGGSHTAGMIQYAYNLYRLNSSQTKISPLSNLIPLGLNSNEGGGDLNQVVGATPIVKISDLDPAYTNIKVYAIKYTALNEIPSINLIEEREIDGTSITIYDDGNTISSLSLEEFLFLGSDPLIPNHIETKDNRLFLANITTNDFILPNTLDCRAYSFNANLSTPVYSDVSLNANGVPKGVRTNVGKTIFNNLPKGDSVNLDYNTYKYQIDNATLGGEGKYIKYALVQKTAAQLGNTPEDYKFFKDNEIYRIGIVFYNRLGQKSLPQWIADFQAPKGNLAGNYNTLQVELKPAYYTFIDNYNFESQDNVPVGYKIIRADRTGADRTIITQGVTSGMMCNVPKDSPNASVIQTKSERATFADSSPKIPNFLLRTFANINPLQANEHLLNMQFSGKPGNNPDSYLSSSTTEPLTEIQYENTEKRAADSFQYTVMQQLYSPEVFFRNLPFTQNLRARVKGGALNNANAGWVQIRNVNTKVASDEVKITGGLHPAAPGVFTNLISGNKKFIFERGLISNSNYGDEESNTTYAQWYRDMTGFQENTANVTVDIYGAPEITERGQGRTIYNKDPLYEYQNTMEGFLTDGNNDFKDKQEGIVSVNTHGAKCLTYVLGASNTITPTNRKKLESLYTESSLNQSGSALIMEIVKQDNEKYVGNIYGGNSYEDKKRTTYLEIGSYNDIAVTSVQIDSPGDTFVQQFNFLRMGKTDTEIYQYNINQISEIVSVNLETTVDLKNRNDISTASWDSRFQPQYEQFHVYNTVYSQEPTLVQNKDVDFNFRRIENFDTRIQSTKLKSPNETIDSWTDILANETMDLNGKFGPINNIIEYKDNIYAFQDEAIAAISINPRVQVQGDDGIGIELGTGGILYDFTYVTTKSGSINKWGMVSTKKGIYYYDALNKGVGRFPDAVTPLLTDIKGLHAFFNKNYNYTSLALDNPVLQSGAVLGYDNYNNDVFVTLHQGGQSFTWCFNEMQDEFVDRKLYLPTKYIYKGDKLISLDATSKLGYEHYAGLYNNYHGVYAPSTITLQVNPQSDLDTVFNNIFFNSELYLNDIDQPDKTLTHITAYSEYQTTGRIPLVLGRSTNLRRKFREWKANIPRVGRNRVRNPWIFLKLELDNTSNYKLILHDITVSYTT